MESRIPRCSYCLVLLPKVIYMDTMKPNFNREITPEENTSCSKKRVGLLTSFASKISSI